MPENIAGLFSITDGNYSRWNYEYAHAWGHWFDLSIFNPFSSFGTTFWTNYVLSDAPLDTPGLTEVERLQTGGYWDVKLFLYRLENVNLATWSPTEVTVLADGNALLKAMKSDQQSLQNRVFLSSPRRSAILAR